MPWKHLLGRLGMASEVLNSLANARKGGGQRPRGRGRADSRDDSSAGGSLPGLVGDADSMGGSDGSDGSDGDGDETVEDLYAELEQREADLHLAAEIGNSLLARNRDLEAAVAAAEAAAAAADARARDADARAADLEGENGTLRRRISLLNETQELFRGPVLRSEREEDDDPDPHGGDTKGVTSPAGGGTAAAQLRRMAADLREAEAARAEALKAAVEANDATERVKAGARAARDREAAAIQRAEKAEVAAAEWKKLAKQNAAAARSARELQNALDEAEEQLLLMESAATERDFAMAELRAARTKCAQLEMQLEEARALQDAARGAAASAVGLADVETSLTASDAEYDVYLAQPSSVVAGSKRTSHERDPYSPTSAGLRISVRDADKARPPALSTAESSLLAELTDVGVVVSSDGSLHCPSVTAASEGAVEVPVVAEVKSAEQDAGSAGAAGSSAVRVRDSDRLPSTGGDDTSSEVEESLGHSPPTVDTSVHGTHAGPRGVEDSHTILAAASGLVLCSTCRASMALDAVDAHVCSAPDSSDTDSLPETGHVVIAERLPETPTSPMGRFLHKVGSVLRGGSGIENAEAMAKAAADAAERGMRQHRRRSRRRTAPRPAAESALRTTVRPRGDGLLRDGTSRPVSAEHTRAVDDVMFVHFMLTASACKVSMAEGAGEALTEEMLDDSDTSALYNRAVAERVPFHQWRSWILSQYSRRVSVAMVPRSRSGERH